MILKVLSELVLLIVLKNITLMLWSYEIIISNIYIHLYFEVLENFFKKKIKIQLVFSKRKHSATFLLKPTPKDALGKGNGLQVRKRPRSWTMEMHLTNMCQAFHLQRLISWAGLRITVNFHENTSSTGLIK